MTTGMQRQDPCRWDEQRMGSGQVREIGQGFQRREIWKVSLFPQGGNLRSTDDQYDLIRVLIYDVMIIYHGRG